MKSAINKKRKTVAVAMSGGVDSAVTAHLLKQKGYKIIGIFMQLGIDGESSMEIAKKNCQIIGADFHSFDLSRTFSQNIINYFLESYERGYTPNPCIKCNQLIKFGELLKVTRKVGADYLATGHYCKKIKNKEVYEIWEADDKNKDQSYFLYTLTQEKLKSVIFPLGSWTKKQVKNIANKAGLLFEQKESQNICFLSGSITQFLKQNLTLNSGPIQSLQGDNLGCHNGLPLFTLGQRRGINIGGSGPYYVAGFDYKCNILYVTNKKEDSVLYTKKLKATDMNWISGQNPKTEQPLSAKTRYNQSKKECSIKQKESDYIVTFKKQLRAIAAGQSIVFYRQEKVLGGGIINKICLRQIAQSSKVKAH